MTVEEIYQQGVCCVSRVTVCLVPTERLGVATFSFTHWNSFIEFRLVNDTVSSLDYTGCSA
jgi:hypothetical protein